jgi:hypothetical protein
MFATLDLSPLRSPEAGTGGNASCSGRSREPARPSEAQPALGHFSGEPRRMVLANKRKRIKLWHSHS